MPSLGYRYRADYELMIDGETVVVTDRKGDVCVISKSDIEICKPCTISVGGDDRVFVTPPNGKRTRLHRYLLAAEPGEEVDHQNHDQWDNRQWNIRICTRQENMRNRRRGKLKGATSRFKGVYWDTYYQKWKSDTKINGKNVFIGYFDKEEDAAKAYDAMAVNKYGEFALTNETMGNYIKEKK